jgi:hypothetical protein
VNDVEHRPPAPEELDAIEEQCQQCLKQPAWDLTPIGAALLAVEVPMLLREAREAARMRANASVCLLRNGQPTGSDPVFALAVIASGWKAEINLLQVTVASLSERVAVQAELLAKRAEKVIP